MGVLPTGMFMGIQPTQLMQHMALFKSINNKKIFIWRDILVKI